MARSDYEVRGVSLLEDLERVFPAETGLEPRRVIGQVDVDPHEARHGTTKEVPLDEPRVCEACDGRGGELKSCSECGGRGRHRTVVDTPARRLLRLDVCEVCGGGGVLPARECPNCGGRGVEEDAAVEVVRVPPGVRDFDTVRVGPEQVAVVKIVPPRRSLVLRLLALVGCMLALAFLLFLLSL